MSVSLSSLFLALITLVTRIINFVDVRNKKNKTTENHSLRRSKGDLEKLLHAIKIRRKIRNANKRHKNNDSYLSVDELNKLRKPKNRYQRDE